MDKKYIFIAMIFIIGMLAISPLSANKNHSNDNTILNDNTFNNQEIIADEKDLDINNKQINLYNDNKDITVLNNDNKDVSDNNNDKNKLKEQNTLSFKDLNRIINSGNTIINLTDNYQYSEGDDDFIKGILIDQSITINGNGITINGSDKARIFQITGNDVIIDNITFTNGKASGGDYPDYNGGAILWTGENGKITNSNFNHNQVKYVGGAIWWTGGNGKITNSNFNNNKANNGNGGAIYWGGGNGKITNSSFNNNQANTEGGGAIRWTGGNGKITNSSFNNNKAKNGGAINWRSDYGNVSSCLFVNNTAPTGSVYLNDHSGNSYCNFTDNILLNNGENEIHFNYIEGSNTDNNWFGHNANNYTDKPSCILGNSRLFLNATANPDMISIYDFSEISFKLYSYDGTDIKDYDNGLLYPVNLTLSASSGSLSNETIRLGENVTFTPSESGTATISAKVEGTDIGTEIIIKVTDGTSFWDLNRTINGNEDTEITLNRNYTYNPEIDSAFIHGIIINRTVTIKGNESTINGSDLARIFQITGKDVIIDNITFTNGNASGDYPDNNGGAIWWSGENGKITNSNFNHNQVKYVGGAIWWTGGNGKITNSNFNNNQANNGNGGAILWSGGNGKVTNSNFKDNQANNFGGAIYWTGGNGKVTNSNFNNNQANNGGGAILWGGGNGKVTNSNFNNNRVNIYGGGAINWYSTYGNVSSCLFVNNTAPTGSAYLNDYYDNSYCNFTDNILLNNGENEISFDYTYGSNTDNNWFGHDQNNYTNKPSGIIGNSRLFLNATTKPDIISLSDVSEISFKLYSYDGEEIKDYDNGLLYPVNLTLSATSGSLSNETIRLGENVTFTPSESGTATISAKVEGTDIGTEIIIKVTDGTSFWDLNRTINGNEDTEITLNRNYTYNPEIDSAFIHGIIINRTVTIKGNESTINGSDLARIFQITGKDVIIDNITFTNGNASGDYPDNTGGAIYWSGGNGKITNSNFNHNQAGTEGGAIFWAGGNGKVTNSSFNNNQANNVGGGAIQWTGENGTITNSSFNDNQANYGGAIQWTGENGKVTNSNFNNNQANNYGGAIIGAGRNGKITNSSFKDNRAKNEGGGAINWYSTYGNVSSCLFINNTAPTGSAYYNDYHDNSYSNFTDNILLNNGENEIHFDYTEGSNTDNNWFGHNANNYTNKPSGIIGNSRLFLNATANPDIISLSDVSEINFKLYSYDGTDIKDYDNGLLYPVNLTVSATSGSLSNETIRLGENVTFTPSEIGTVTISAKVEGTDIGTEIIIKVTDGRSFSDLNRTINGNEDTEITLNRNYTYNPEIDSAFIHGIIINRTVTIKGNDSTINGSDMARIFQITGNDVIIDNITFTNGNASGEYYPDDSGGAIYWIGENGTVTNSNFNNNQARYIGGVIYWTGGNGKITNSNFNHNQADYGGAIRWTGENGTVTNSNFNNNQANTYGGAILWTGENGTVTNSSFKHNQANNSGGGAINWYSTYGNVSSCLFVNNTAPTGSAYLNDYDDNSYSNFTDNILLNNGENEISFEKPEGSSTDNNWFGQNASNYTEKPSTIGELWLFINGTADPNTVTMMGSSNITFQMYTYNGSSGNITPFDGLLYPINLTLLSLNGDLDKVNADLNENIVYSPNAAGPGSVTAKIENAECTITFENIKADSGLNVSVDKSEIDYGNNATVLLEFNPLASGTVNITLTGKKHTIELKDEKINESFVISNLLPDEYNITVYYSGDERFDSAVNSSNETLTVNHMESDIAAETFDVNVTDSTGLLAIISLPEDTTGTLNISSDTYNTIIDLKDGKKEGSLLKILFHNDGLPVGKYNFTFTYMGDDIYKGSSINGISNVLIIETELTPRNETINLLVGEESEITYDLSPSDAIGEISFSSDKAELAIVHPNGTVEALGEGTATITIQFTGNGNYSDSNATVQIDIKKQNVQLTAENITAVYNTESYLEISLKDKDNNPLNGYEVIVDLNGENTYNTSSNGTALIPLKDLAANEYAAKISFPGDEKYAESNTTAKIIIQKDSSKITAEDVTSTYNEENYLEISLKDGQDNPIGGAEVSVDLNGIKKYTTDSDGTIKVPTKELGANTYNAKISFAGDENYTESSAEATVTVNKDKTEISTSNLNITYKEENYLTATLKDSQGNPISDAEVSVDLNGIKKYTTDSNGTIKVPTKDLPANTYNATISFDGSNNYLESTANADVIVNRIKTRFIYSDMNTTAFDSKIEGRIGKYFYFQLVDEYGNPLVGKRVSVGFNGVVYNRTTNETGGARLQINLRCVNLYTFAVSFSGDDEYAGDFEVALINVTPQTPKLTTSSKTYKASAKTKTLTATLKSFKGTAVPGKKITFKVNGKKYTAKTNSKGIATVKVSLNKKGSYKFTVSFAGDNTYKKISKTAKLTIK